MTDTSRGFATRFGWKREALVYTPTWPGTAIALSDILPFLSEGIIEDITLAENDEALGYGARRAPDLISKRYAGPVHISPLPYEGIEGILCAALGFEAPAIGSTDMPEELAIGAYRHLFECDHTLTDRAWSPGEGWVCGEGLYCGQQKIRRGTLAFDKQVSVWEFRSAMFSRLTMRCTPQAIGLFLEVVAYDLDLASATNTAGAMAVLTLPINTNLLMTDASLWIGPFSAGTALDSDDAIKFNQAEIVLDNNLVADDQTAESGLYIDAPARGGSILVTGTFATSRYEDNTQINRLINDNELMARLDFTGSEIGATGENYEFTIWIPSFKLAQANAAINGAGLVRPTYSLTAGRPSETPAGFPTNIKGGPLMIEVVSAESSHPML